MGEVKEYIQNFGEEICQKTSTCKTRRRWEDNIIVYTLHPVVAPLQMYRITFHDMTIVQLTYAQNFHTGTNLLQEA